MPVCTLLLAGGSTNLRKSILKTRTALAHWYSLAKRNNFSSFGELRALFPAADHVGKLTVFNIGGNKVRLIAAIHYNRQRIYIRAVLTHAEYDEGKWKE